MHSNLFILTGLLLTLQSLWAGEIRHRFLAKDESRSQLLYVDQTDPLKDWVIQLGAKCRDTQLAGKNILLVSSPDGYREYSLADRQMIKEVKGYRWRDVRPTPARRSHHSGLRAKGSHGV